MNLNTNPACRTSALQPSSLRSARGRTGSRRLPPPEPSVKPGQSDASAREAGNDRLDSLSPGSRGGSLGESVRPPAGAEGRERGIAPWFSGFARNGLKPVLRLPLLGLLAMLLIPAAHAEDELDLASVNWRKVTSQLRWLNFYEDQTTLTVHAGKTPCLKKVRYAGHYAPTPFPAGNYSGRLIDDRDGKELAKFSLGVKDGQRHCLVTMGNPKSGATCAMLKEDPPAKDQRESRIQVYNMLSAAPITWQPGEGHPGTPQPLEPGGSHSLEFSTARGYLGVAVLPVKKASDAVSARDAEAMASFRAPPAAAGENWLVFIHRDAITTDGLRVTVVKEGEAGLFEPGGGNDAEGEEDIDEEGGEDE